MLYKSGFTYKACGEIIKYNPSTKQCIQFELTKYQFGPHPLIFWSLEPIPDDSEQEAGLAANQSQGKETTPWLTATPDLA